MSGVMEMASDLLGKVGKPAYVEFSTVAKHLPRQSEEKGYAVYIDVDLVTVRQIGATDSVIYEVPRWLDNIKAEVRAQRLPLEHAQHYEKMYKLWKQGQELPVEGTPIKGWAVIPPSQQEAIVRAGVRTVEDLAQMNAEAMSKIGMGAVMLKNKAQAWVSQAKDKGPATMEIAQLKNQNDILSLNVQKLTEQVTALLKERPTNTAAPSTLPNEEPQTGISLSEIMDEEPKRSHKKKEA